MQNMTLAIWTAGEEVSDGIQLSTTMKSISSSRIAFARYLQLAQRTSRLAALKFWLHLQHTQNAMLKAQAVKDVH